MLNKRRKFSRGFGILEVVISCAIIIVILGALVFIARSSLTNAQYMQERAQAVSLAAEAIETVRQNRDSNYIDGNASTKWDTIGSASTSSIIDGNYFYVGNARTTFQIPISLLPTGSDSARLRINNGSTQVINMDGVNFTRKIEFFSISETQLLTLPTNVSNNGKNGFLTKIEVTWNGAGGKKDSKVEVEELITNSRFVY